MVWFAKFVSIGCYPWSSLIRVPSCSWIGGGPQGRRSAMGSPIRRFRRWIPVWLFLGEPDRAVQYTYIALGSPVGGADCFMEVGLLQINVQGGTHAGWKREYAPHPPWRCPGCGHNNKGSHRNCIECLHERPKGERHGP